MKKRYPKIGCRFLIAGAAALLVSFSCTVLLAATNVYDPKNNPTESLTDYHDRGLIGGRGDNDALAVGVWKLLDENIKPDSKVRIAKGSRGLAMVARAAMERWPDALDGSPKHDVITAISQSAKLFLKGTPGEYGKTTWWDIDSEELIWSPIKGVEVQFDKDFLTGNCEDPASTKCLESFKDAVYALRMAELGYRCVAYMEQDRAIYGAYNYFKMRSEQWDTYFNRGIPQWPWELIFVNGPIYGMLTRDEMGSVPPPTFQLIFAHPDLALEYMPDADDGDQFKPVLMIEAIGVDVWSWENDGSQGGPLFGYPLGAGVVATYSDRANEDDWGWGGIVHINHTLNIGATFRDGDPCYFISVNAAKLFRDVTEQKKKLGEKLGF